MGEQLCGQSEWFTITQGQTNEFADVTQDHQYLHVDR
ncbi:MAG: acyl dehydratase [Porticoccus sp.]|jgi:acyl dehydratase